jgi:hypothetical protein
MEQWQTAIVTVTCYAVGSESEFCALRFALHLGPSHIAVYINGIVNAHIPHNRTYVHPGLNESRMMFMIATRVAPIEQRTRLF